MKISSNCLMLSVTLVLLTSCAPMTGPVLDEPMVEPAPAPEARVVTQDTQASESSIVLALRSLEGSEGGDLEDAYRYLGIEFTNSPSKFLSSVQDSELQKEKIPNLFVMLPLDFVDRPCEGLKELSRRQSMLRTVDGFDEIKRIADPAISKSIQRKIKQCDAES